MLKTKEKMLELYGTEMNILNKVSIKNIEENSGLIKLNDNHYVEKNYDKL